ncbi:hypothetical protein ACWEPC_49145, partial [Nonomuraea sp. NPDC004297]
RFSVPWQRPYLSSEPHSHGLSRVTTVSFSSRIFARTSDNTLAHWWSDPAYAEPRHAVWPGPLHSDPVTVVAREGQHVFGAAAPGGPVTHWWWDRAGGVQQEDWGGQLGG